jgi:hypothetical protein
MNNPARRPPPYVLQALAGILQKLPIYGFDFASRRHPNNKSGDAVHEQARIVLARLQCFLRQLAVFDVSTCAVPSNDLASFIV